MLGSPGFGHAMPFGNHLGATSFSSPQAPQIPQDRLSPLDSERIISILEDSIEKLSFLDSITPDILQHRDELSKFIGDEIARTLSEQKKLEGKYENLIEQRSMLKGLVNKMRYREIQEEIQEVSRALRESTNNLVRSLKENPNISGNLIKVQRDRTELQDLLLRCVQELRERGKFLTIINKVDEDNTAKAKFLDLKDREKQLRETVSHLQTKLNEDQILFQHQTTEKKQEILDKKLDLTSKKSTTSINLDFNHKESKASVAAIWREYKHKEYELENRVKKLEEKLHIENIVNNETKEFLNKKILSLQESLLVWESKYDKDIINIENKTSELELKRNTLLEKLNVLKERKIKDDLYNSNKLEEQERIKREKLLEIETKKIQNRSAKIIQAQFLIYIKRKREADAIKAEAKKAKAAAKAKAKKGKK